MTPDICIFHHPCMDGFTAAWAVHKRWPDIEFIPANYGDEPPDVLGKNVLIVDFSYPKDVLVKMGQVANSVTVLDHHKTAQADLAEFAAPDFDYRARSAMRDAVVAVFDMNRSGAMLAWEFCHPMERAPTLVKHVQDRDLWKFEMPYTRKIHAYLSSIERSFENWDDTSNMLASVQGRARIIGEGEAILRSFLLDVKSAVDATRRFMQIGNYIVPVANLPGYMASEGAGMLAEGEAFGASYYDSPKGRVFSLRVRDSHVDVSAIAKLYGGGGHAKAAGFTVERGWEGERP